MRDPRFMSGRPLKFVLYRNRKKEWAWRLKAANGEIVAQGEGYKCVKTMILTIGRIKAMVALAELQYEAAGRERRATQ